MWAQPCHRRSAGLGEAEDDGDWDDEGWGDDWDDEEAAEWDDTLDAGIG